MPYGKSAFMTFLRRGGRPTRTSRIDTLLAVELGALAFLLGCYDLFDPDIWWHLKAGQWILEHHRIPYFDIFTYSSGDRVWVDLHWGFQVALALAYAAAGVAGMILMAAATGCAVVLVPLMAGAPHWPRWVAVLCWLPALALMAMRFDPRPEIFSLLYLAGYLAILLQADRRPEWLWSLPLIQLLWVNSHALFVFGPIVLGCYWVAHATQALVGPTIRDQDAACAAQPRWWQLFIASAAVAIACLVNPYGVRGAFFPLELFPKISDPANPYKAYVDEFTGLREFVRTQMKTAPAFYPHVRAQFFLLLLLPWSFVLPAASKLWHSTSVGSEQTKALSFTLWAGGLVLSCVLITAAVLGIPLSGTPPWLVSISRAAPFAILGVGVGVSLVLAARSRLAATTMAVGAATVAAWTFWLFHYFFEGLLTNRGMGGPVFTYIVAGLVAMSLPLVVRGGASVFRLLLMGTFTYLSFQAVRNINLFGLVAGSVLAWNLSEWFARLTAERPHRPGAWVAPTLVAGLVTLGAVAVVTNYYYRFTGDYVHFGLRERPLTFAHEAARFAGRAGLPRQALVYDIGQTGVYIYHNGPARKVFMDARLELPSLATFQTYVRIEEWLNHNDPRWDAAVARLGDPLVLISHEASAEGEAALLAHPRWRCLYFDPVASVFVTREGPTSAPTFPDHDFMADHFRTVSDPFVSADTKSVDAEAAALFQVGHAVRKRGGDPWRTRIPILTRASDLTRASLARGPADLAIRWRLLGLIHWDLAPDLTHAPPGPFDPWDPATGLSWARASYCFRRALEIKPEDVPTLRSLAECYAIRGMTDAKREIELLLKSNTDAARPGTPMIENHPSSAAVPWSTADRRAVNDLHLGDPTAAERAWREATPPPSPGLRLMRLASADLVVFDASAAMNHCRQALALEPRLGEAWYLLAIANLDSGNAEGALAACREGLKYELTPPQRDSLEGVDRLLSRYAQPN